MKIVFQNIFEISPRCTSIATSCYVGLFLHYFYVTIV